MPAEDANRGREGRAPASAPISARVPCIIHLSAGVPA